MKVAIIGYGNVAQYYITALKKLAKDIFVCSTHKPEKLDKDFTFFTNYKDRHIQLVDLIIVATPPYLHLDMTEFFLERKRKIILEKPAVISLKELSRLREMSADNNNLYFAYHSVFNPLIQQARRFINSSDIKSIKVNYQECVFRYHPNKNNWIFNSKYSGGGCLIDSGINIFSILYQFIPKLSYINGVLKKRKLLVEDYININLSSENNVKVSLKMNWLSNEEKREFVFNSNPAVKVNLAVNKISINDIKIKLLDKKIDRIDLFSEYEYLLKDALNYFQAGKTLLNHSPLLPLETVLSIYRKNSYA